MRLPVAACSALILAAGLAAGPAIGRAVEPPEPEPAAAQVERLIELLRENYVLEDRLEQIEEHLRQGVTAGRYQGIADLRSLASRLTEELRAASGDLHFGVRPMPRAVPDGEAAGGPSPKPPTGDTGLGRVAVLDGGVGYLEIRAFADPSLGGPAADAALLELADTAALILDLRWSRGGRPEMVAYLLSYLFDGEPFVFNRFHWRNTGRTLEMSTRADLPSPRYADHPVFALVSGKTPSAAEGFTYHLKQYRRATVVGERTAGAAHTTQLFPLGELQVAIPTGRPISAVSGGSWEGTGVEPDHQVPAGEALAVAYRMALEGLLAATAEAAARARLEEILESAPSGDQ